jgi:hypothetical protein
MEINVKDIVKAILDKGVYITWIVFGDRRKVNVDSKVAKVMKDFYNRIHGGKNAVHKK